MENPFLSKESEISYWASLRAQIDGMSPSYGCGTRNSISEDVLNRSPELMNLDANAVWCNNQLAADQLFTSHGLLSLQSIACASFDTINVAEQSSTFPIGGNKFEQANAEFDHHLDLMDADGRGTKQSAGAQPHGNISNLTSGGMLYKPVGISLDEKMLRALSSLKEFLGAGILAQVWIPVKRVDQYILTTFEQPYLLDHILAGYREVSRTYVFSAEGKPGLPLGLPGRVFMSKVPEWTSNVVYYSNTEYLRIKHALHYKVRGSIALPIFEPPEMSCCAVLELVTVKEKPDFDSELENVCLALQSVNLTSTTPRQLLLESFASNQRAALAEITDVLRAICLAHRLPLALTWIPCNFVNGAVSSLVKVRSRDGDSRSRGKSILCIWSKACYVKDGEMEGFIHACLESYVEEGQGITGKAFQSNHPFFSPDVKAYNISEYPLVHHARKYGLNAAVAIKLRSTYAGDDDYILEFFLPVNMKDSSEQQLLMNNLLGTMHRICKTLRTVSNAVLAGQESCKVEFQKGAVLSFPWMAVSASSQTTLSETNNISTDKISSLNVSSSRNDALQSHMRHEQVTGDSRRQMEKKTSTAEKTVSLSVLQQYFSGSLKNAAKSIGVCPTTLKKMCRQHGISRWPSRKINKVNRSLQKIQTVLDSVQGVEGRLKFDPTSGGLVAVSAPSVSCINGNNSAIKVEEDDCYIDAHGALLMKSGIPVNGSGEDSRLIETKSGVFRTVSIDFGPWWCLKNGSTFAKCSKWGLDKCTIRLENSNARFGSTSSCPLAAADDFDTKMDGNDGNIEIEHKPPNQATYSSLTDSSDGCGSLMHGNISSSPSLEEGKHSNFRISSDDNGSKITAKATYKEDTIRFKFEPSEGCLLLYEEVAKRFKLQNGTFQLRYLDDEGEWVMLVSDLDLLECVEMLNCVGAYTMKLLVRNITFSIGSSSSSNCFLGGSS